MSVVDNFILIAPFEFDYVARGSGVIDDPGLDALNAFLVERVGDASFRIGMGFKRVSHLAGGRKAIEANVFMLATNFLRADVLVPLLREFFDRFITTENEERSCPYLERVNVQLFNKTQDSETERFEEVRIWL